MVCCSERRLHALLTCHSMLAAPGMCRHLGLPLLEAAAAATALLHTLSGMPEAAAAPNGSAQAAGRLSEALKDLSLAMACAAFFARACKQSAVATAAERVLGGALKLLAVSLLFVCWRIAGMSTVCYACLGFGARGQGWPLVSCSQPSRVFTAACSPAASCLQALPTDASHVVEVWRLIANLLL